MSSPSSFTYQWLRNGVNISGQTASSYILVEADIGQIITCKVIGTNQSGSVTSTSQNFGPITDGTNMVLNSTAATDVSNATLGNDVSVTTLTQATGVTPPSGQSWTTAFQITRTAPTDSFCDILFNINNPTLIAIGVQFTVNVWVKVQSAGSWLFGLLLANPNYAHQPSANNFYATFTDTNWHQITYSDIATANADVDTSVYLQLPYSGATTILVSGVTLTSTAV